MPLEAHERLDLRGVPCPANAAKALVKIATMNERELLEVLLDDGEPMENLPPAIEEEGHKIIERHQQGDSHWVVLIEVGT